MVPAFEQVTRRNYSAIKTSALFKYVSKRPGALKFNAIISKLIADGNAYLLIFKEAVDSNALVLFSEAGYIIDADNPPHIRFDKEYGNPNSSFYRNKFFAHWHYTERLVHKSDNTKIVLHYYFHRSMLLDIVVTRPDGSKHILDQATKIRLEKNTERALMVMGLLFKALDKHKDDLNNEFETLATQISTNSFIKQSSVAELQVNLKKLKEISDAINELEEDFIDSRFEVIKKRFEVTINNKMHPQEAPRLTQDDSEKAVAKTATLAVKESALVPKFVRVPKDNIIEVKPVAILLENTNKLIAAYQSVAAKDLVELDKHREELIIDLLLAYLSCKDTGSQKEIEGMQAKVLAQRALQDYLEMYLLAGDYENFIALYEAASLKIIPQTFAKYIGIFLSPEFAERESEHVKICKYLFANAPEYAIFLEFVTSLTNILEGSVGDEKAVSCSIFFLFVNNDLYEFFCMLIQQTRNPNMYGLVVGEHMMSLLLSILPIRNTERYIDFLLAQGAQSEKVYYSYQYRFISQIPAASDKFAALSVLPMGKAAKRDKAEHHISRYDYNICIAKPHSCLAGSLLYDFIADELTKKFAALASLYDVAYASSCFLSTSARFGRVPVKQADMRNYATNESKNDELSKIFSEAVTPCNHFLFGFYFKKPEEQRKAQLCLDIFKERVTAASKSELGLVIKKLADKMLKYKQAKDWEQAGITSEAALYCLNFTDPNAKTHIFIKWLLGHIVDINNSRFMATGDPRYKQAVDSTQLFSEIFVKFSEFSNELTEKSPGAPAKPR
jgi:hypothetical protein